MDNQTAFNIVCAHLMAAEGRSLRAGDEGSACAYAGADGRACAVGCLLPRELCERLDQMNNTGWDDVVWAADGAHRNGYEQAREAVRLLAGVDANLLRELQCAHDDRIAWLYEKKILRKRLDELAEQYGLQLPACVEVKP